jgi:hypothetical protein
LSFALLAGPLSWFALVLAAPLFGQEQAFALYGLGCVALHPLFIADNLGRGVRACLLAAALCFVAAVMFGNPVVLGTLAPAILALVRSAYLFPKPLGRALFFELAFNVAALGALGFFYDAGPIGCAFASWSFWLIQSAFALLPGVRSAPTAGPSDPFERAHAAAIQLLERSGH